MSTSLRPIPAVGYARRSTDKQEASIHEQKRAVERYAAEHGYSILRWYVDDAISGDDTERRLDFLRMLSDASKGDYQAILCWDQDRFGRFSPHEASFRTYPLAQAGIRLVTVDKGPIDWTDFTEWLTYSVNQHAKHQFLKDLSRNVARGQMEAMRSGFWGAGSPPYGYRLDGPRKAKRLVLGDPSHVRIVQRIYREFVEEGRSTYAIAKRLQADAIPSPGGKDNAWLYGTVRGMLTNPAYAGDFVAGKWTYGKYHRIGKDSVLAASDHRGRKPQAEFTHRDNHEAIVSRPVWERAQDILATRTSGITKPGRSPYHPAENPYLFTGLLRCGRCGSPMCGGMMKSGNFRFYKCSKAHRSRGIDCKGSTVREDRLLHYMADYLAEEFAELESAIASGTGEFDPKKLPKAFAKVRSFLAAPAQGKREAKRIQSELKSLAGRIEKARRNLIHLDPENIAAAQGEIRRMTAEHAKLQAEAQRLSRSEKSIADEATEILRKVWWLVYLCRTAAQEAGRGEDPGDWADLDLPVGSGVMTGAGQSPLLRKYLRGVAGIVVQTTGSGKGGGRRHEFDWAEVSFLSGERSGAIGTQLEPALSTF